MENSWMDCNNCGDQHAEVTLTEIESDEMKTLHLCSTCAALKGITIEGPGLAPVADLLAHLGGVSDDVSSSDALECEYCGTQSSEFRKTGRLGCPQCYAQFPKQLRAVLQRVHGAAQHIGKIYLGSDLAETKPDLERASLKRRLERAVEVEDFELAANLRDKMKLIKNLP
jgi:protein arginine kinase activator